MASGFFAKTYLNDFLDRERLLLLAQLGSLASPQKGFLRWLLADFGDVLRHPLKKRQGDSLLGVVKLLNTRL